MNAISFSVGLIILLGIYGVSSFFLTILPSAIASFVAGLIIYKKLKKHTPVLPLLTLLTINSWIAAIIWFCFIRNNLYYAWDTIVIPFSFIYHEAPSLKLVDKFYGDWNQTTLALVWYALVLCTYAISGAVALIWRKHPDKQYTPFVLLSLGILTIITTASLALFLGWI